MTAHPATWTCVCGAINMAAWETCGRCGRQHLTAPAAEAISALANDLQVAVPTAARLRQRLDEQARDADALATALDRAMQAVRRLLPRPDRETGGTR